MAKKIKIPTRFLRIAPQIRTIATRGRGGRFIGRKPVKGLGDTTKARYLSVSKDFNKDGRIGPNERGGIILGRTQKIRASRRARGYERRV